jgi:hypothetical protein
MVKKFISSIQTTRFQQMAIFFTIFFVASMLSIQYKRSYFSEKNLEISHVSEMEKRLASKVHVGLLINNFPRFSFYENRFIVDAVVWFRFPVGTESINTIEKFSFQNGNIVSKSEPIVQMSGNDVIVSYHVVVKFITPLSYKHFPASDHKLTLVLQNKSVGPAELYFHGTEKDFELSGDILTGNWQAGKRYVSHGYINAKEADFPSVVFTIDFYNNDLRHYILLYLPLFLIFFLIFTSLLIKVGDLHLRLPIVAGVVPILALHSLVIERVSPRGSSITKVDEIYLMLVVLSMFILIFQAYLGLTMKAHYDAEEELSKEEERSFKLLVLCALIAALTYVTFF